MKTRFLFVSLWLASAAIAAPPDAAIFAGYALGVSKSGDTIQFELPLEGANPSRAGMQRTEVYADRRALVGPGTITKCDLAELGGPAFPSTLVRLWLPEADAKRIQVTLHGWTESVATDRTLIFVSGGQFVHGHDPALAGISESMLYLQIGSKRDAESVLEAICGEV